MEVDKMIGLLKSEKKVIIGAFIFMSVFLLRHSAIAAPPLSDEAAKSIVEAAFWNKEYFIVNLILSVYSKISKSIRATLKHVLSILP